MTTPWRVLERQEMWMYETIRVQRIEFRYSSDRFAAERQRRLFSARVVGSNGVALNRKPLAIGGDEAVAASAFTEDDRAASDVYT